MVLVAPESTYHVELMCPCVFEATTYSLLLVVARFVCLALLDFSAAILALQSLM
ncbi:hypothetical protein M758_5G069100 [Ceratodon purpureus]|nr:hypothetical protein M758_5G069100 [Ceratodon purpureus]